MLRRAPTTISLTAADLETYEANRQRKLWEKQQQQQNGDSQSSSGSDMASNEREPMGQRGTSQQDRILGAGAQGRRKGN